MSPTHVADRFLQACLMPDGMSAVLDAFARDGEAEGAVLVHERHGRTIQLISSASISEAVSDYLIQDHPPDPRAFRVNPGLGESFRVDHDDFTQDELEHDPFYQEFLRPRGVGWHACALLARLPTGDALHISLKRSFKAAPFDSDILRRVSAQLPMLRAVAQFGARIGAETDIAVGLAETRQRFLYRLHSSGRATAASAPFDTNPVLSVRTGILRAHDPKNQQRLAAAISRALRTLLQTAALLTDEDGLRWSIRAIPTVLGGETDCLAWIVLSRIDLCRDESTAGFVNLGADLFGLSKAEARVAFWIMRGEPVKAIAKRLNSKPGTVLNQLKAVFQKTGVSRQVELAALLLKL